MLVTCAVALHVICKARYNDTCITQLRSPPLYPLKGYIAVVVYSIESLYHILYRNIALAEKSVLYASVLTENTVLYLYELYVLAKIGNCSLR